MPRLDAALFRIQQWDAQWCMRVHFALRDHPALVVFRGASRLGDGLFWYALMLWLAATDGPDAFIPVVNMVAAGLACTVVYKVLKQGTGRLRPCEAQDGIAACIAPLDRFSFPSGHTLHSVCFTLVACAYHPALAWLLVPFTALVAASRLALGLHYPSDVLAGAVLGAAIAGLSLAAF